MCLFSLLNYERPKTMKYLLCHAKNGQNNSGYFYDVLSISLKLHIKKTL